MRHLKIWGINARKFVVYAACIGAFLLMILSLIFSLLSFIPDYCKWVVTYAIGGTAVIYIYAYWEWKEKWKDLDEDEEI